MDKQLSQNEQKLIAIIKHAPVGLVEIEPDGSTRTINIKAEEALNPIFETYHYPRTNIFPLLHYFDPEIVSAIESFSGGGGVILQGMYTVEVPGPKPTKKNYLIVANKQVDGTIMVSFDDFTERVAREAAVRQMEIDKAVEQEKHEIASDVLHDIGNAVVGFGSYLTRIRRLLEQNDPEKLEMLVHFFSAKRSAMSDILGKEKSDALMDMLTGIHAIQRSNHTEISKAITEQLHIVSHIQEVLEIQRQYVSGRKAQERKQVNIRTILNDSLAMLLASFDRRGIAVSINAQAKLPLIDGDRTKLMQVILNILKNSLEAIEEDAEQKFITIDLNASPHSINLIIRDSGRGFDQKNSLKLFERNFSTKSSGSGLGLYNCKAIVENHSGSLELSSEGPGKGATATIEFRLN